MPGGVLILMAWLLGADRYAIPEDLGAEEKRQIEIFRRASESVVHIGTAALRRGFFNLDIFEVPQGTGSGFIWDKHGTS